MESGDTTYCQHACRRGQAQVHALPVERDELLESGEKPECWSATEHDVMPDVVRIAEKKLELQRSAYAEGACGAGSHFQQ
jgi:hypothetical protein